ncbi:MAG TPA: cytochrome c oxidase subunit II [Labilithrix sp.]
MFGGSPLAAQSPQARAIADLFGDTMIICAAILALVTGLVAYSIWRFRDRGGADPEQVEGNKRLEIAWTAAPLAIVAGIFALTLRAMNASDPPPDREPDLTVIGHQWWWEVRYKSGAVTANEIHVPTGKPLVIAVESADVVHDFWVPELGRKIDAVPGHENHVWMQADAPGTYIGACAEYCGVQHAWMRILVVAQAPEDFAAWEKRTLAPAAMPPSESAARGAKLFTSMTCVKCHAVAGADTRDSAKAAPDLTHLADRTTLGAGIMKNDADGLARWLKHPQEIKQGSHMPDEQLSDAQVADFVAYFGALK